MEQLFYQSSWQNVSFQELRRQQNPSEVVGRSFYSDFYRAFLSGERKLDARWIDQKKKIGEWLAGQFPEHCASLQRMRLISLGAGLGAVEAWLWENGFEVDVVDYECYSLKSILDRFPEMKGIVGDVRNIPCRSETYDLAYLAMVDYCFDRSQYTQILRDMARLIKSNGKIISICGSNLSVKGIAVGAARRLLEKPLSFFLKNNPSHRVAWGFTRTLGEHVKAGREAGLFSECIHLFDRNFQLKKVRRPETINFDWITMKEDIVAITFSRKGSVRG